MDYKALDYKALDYKAFGGGLVGGLVGVSFSHSFDTTRVVYQSNVHYKSLVDVVKDIWRNDGIRGFYRGRVIVYP